MPLSGKTVLVTGASAGIGRATAIALAQAGAKILATGRRRAQLDALKQQCGSAVETNHRNKQYAAMAKTIAKLQAQARSAARPHHRQTKRVKRVRRPGSRLGATAGH